MSRGFRHWEIILRDLRPWTSDLGPNDSPRARSNRLFSTHGGWRPVTSALVKRRPCCARSSLSPMRLAGMPNSLVNRSGRKMKGPLRGAIGPGVCVEGPRSDLVSSHRLAIRDDILVVFFHRAGEAV